MAFLRKSDRDSGLGISLEGTVDVEEGQEVRPHHYIRSILPGGPVGRERTLQPGDELLQVSKGSALKVTVQYHIIVGGDPISTYAYLMEGP